MTSQSKQDQLSHYYFHLPYISLRGKEREVIDYWMKKEKEEMKDND